MALTYVETRYKKHTTAAMWGHKEHSGFHLPTNAKKKESPWPNSAAPCIGRKKKLTRERVAEPVQRAGDGVPKAVLRSRAGYRPSDKGRRRSGRTRYFTDLPGSFLKLTGAPWPVIQSSLDIAMELNHVKAGVCGPSRD